MSSSSSTQLPKVQLPIRRWGLEYSSLLLHLVPIPLKVVTHLTFYTWPAPETFYPSSGRQSHYYEWNIHRSSF